MILMILKVVGIAILCLFILFLFYPLRFGFSVFSDGDKTKGKVILYPVFTLKCFGYTIFDSDKPKTKTEKGKKAKKSEKEKNEPEEAQKSPKELPPIYELLLTAINLIGKLKKGMMRQRVNLHLAYGFPDPSLTGELTGAIYAALPPFFGDLRHCHWRVGLYPVWCTEKTVADVHGEMMFCVFGELLAFGGMLPEILKIIPRKKKKAEVKK